MSQENKIFHTCSFMNLESDLDKSIPKLYDFLKDFDPIQLKYSTDPYKISNTGKQYSRVPSDMRDELLKYDETYNFESLNKESYSSITENLGLVYGSSKIVENDIKIFDLTEEKFIAKYLAIPQLTKMFDEDYFQFEWDMHVAQNFREHRNNYQRDHFIHQIRDMYSMLILLGEHGFFKACVKVLRDKKASKVSSYTQKKLSEFVHSQKGINSRFKKIDELIYRYYPDEECKNETDHDEKIRIAVEKYKEKYFMKYVIYASTVMCALFHDMGYPICHFLETRNRTSQYNPTMYMFVRNEVESFDHIASLLSSSLLFTVVSRENIRESMKLRSNGTYNHGAYSAIAFLMQFYNSGIIFSLPKEKQCAIELAALAIYNHTLAYKVAKKEADTYYQPVFKQDPISFMLRMCDDLQEWNRRYFVVSEESDIPVCSKCFTPSIAHSDSKNAKITYRCMCSSKEQATVANDYNSFRYYNFYNRKLYLVSTCDYMTSEIISKNKKRVLCFHINYDYYRLLNVTRINPTYAKFRLSELNELKEVIKDQDYRSLFDADSDSYFDYIYLDYFMTANPLSIKIKILEEYIRTKLKKNVNEVRLFDIIDKKRTDIILDSFVEISISDEDQSKLDSDDILSKIYSYANKQDVNNVLSEYFKEKNINVDDNVLSIFINKLELETIDARRKALWSLMCKEIKSDSSKHTLFDFYKDLLEKSQELRNRSDNKEVITEAVYKFMNMWFSECTSKYYCQIMKNLITESFEQYSKECTLEESLCSFDTKDFQDKYKKQYAPNDDCDDALYDSVIAYCNSENDFNCYDKNIDNNQMNYISYFTDLYFFEWMNRDIQDNYINNP